MVVEDLVRKTLAATPKLDALRMAAPRKTGTKTLQEEGILMVVRAAPRRCRNWMRVLKG